MELLQKKERAKGEKKVLLLETRPSVEDSYDLNVWSHISGSTFHKPCDLHMCYNRKFKREKCHLLINPNYFYEKHFKYKTRVIRSSVRCILMQHDASVSDRANANAATRYGWFPGQLDFVIPPFDFHNTPFQMVGL